MTVFPRHPGSQKYAMWAAIPAFVWTVVQIGLVLDLGFTLRSDSVEFNYARWIG